MEPNNSTKARQSAGCGGEIGPQILLRELRELVAILAALLVVAGIMGFVMEHYIVTVVCVPTVYVLLLAADRREGD